MSRKGFRMTVQYLKLYLLRSNLKRKNYVTEGRMSCGRRFGGRKVSGDVVKDCYVKKVKLKNDVRKNRHLMIITANDYNYYYMLNTFKKISLFKVKRNHGFCFIKKFCESSFCCTIKH